MNFFTGRDFRAFAFVLISISFIGGVIAGSVFDIPELILLTAFLLCGALVTICGRYHAVRIGVVIVACGVLGIARIDSAERKQLDQRSLARWNGKTFTLVGSVREKDVRLDRVKITVAPHALLLNETSGEIPRIGHEELFTGFALVTLPVDAAIAVEDRVSVTCSFETPGKIRDFDYGAYLRLFGVYSVCYRPARVERIQISSERTLHITERTRVVLAEIRERVKRMIDTHLPYPSSAFLAALVFGMRRELPEALLTDFSRASVTHIIAVSGSHISVIVALIWTWLLGVGLRRSWAFFITVFFIIFFLALIGFIPSAIRAGIMGVVVLLARYYGRPRNVLRALLCAAALMLAFNPFLARWDVGFQLSFLAVVGIMYLEPPLLRLCERLSIPECGFLQIKSTLAVSLAAQIFVLPWTVYYFQTISLVGPFVNLLVLPLANLLLLMGIAFVTVGVTHPAVAEFIGWWAHQLAALFMFIVQFFAHLPWAARDVTRFSLLTVCGAYAFLGVMLWRIKARERSMQQSVSFSRKPSVDLDQTIIKLSDDMLQ